MQIARVQDLVFLACARVSLARVSLERSLDRGLSLLTVLFYRLVCELSLERGSSLSVKLMHTPLHLSSLLPPLHVLHAGGRVCCSSVFV